MVDEMVAQLRGQESVDHHMVTRSRCCIRAGDRFTGLRVEKSASPVITISPTPTMQQSVLGHMYCS